MKSLSLIFGLAIAISTALWSHSALAQNAHSWVSNTGLDTNPCTLAQPCATFVAAYDVTNAGGEIICLNPGIFYSSTTTPFTIGHSLKIRCKGVHAGIDGEIVVAAGPTDKVVLNGLTIGAQGFPNCVQFNSGAFLYIFDSSLGGSSFCVRANSTTPNARVFIKGSTISGASQAGVLVNPAGSTVNIVSIVDSLLDSNGPIAVSLTTPGAILGLQSSILNGSPAAISLSGGASAYTVGGTNSVNGTFTFNGTIPLN
jgi:hypothetical protein